MANIVLFIPPSTGAMNASFRLARELLADGHNVVYVGVPDCEEYIRRNGLQFRPVFGRWFPKGFFPAAAAQSSLTGLTALAQRQRRSAYLKRFLSALHNELRQEFATLMAEVKPDLCLIASAFQDSTMWGLLLHELNIQCAYLNETFMRPAEKFLPPVCSSFVPSAGILSKVRIWFEWRTLLHRKRLVEWIAALLGIGVDWRKEFKKLATTCSYPVQSLNFNDMISPRLQLPEIVLWPQEFDFPQAEKHDRIYIGPHLDLTRQQPSFPWKWLNNNNHLIYCALGSMRFLKPSEYRKFYQCVIDAASTHLGKQWVIAIGDSINAEDLHCIPENVLIVKWAPQLAILERAHIMITHGGANTVKECVWFGVPMILFPIGVDHPGTAARAVFHGLGLIGNVHQVSPSMIGSLIKRIDLNPSFRSQIAIMRNLFRGYDGEHSSASIRALLARQFESLLTSDSKQ